MKLKMKLKLRFYTACISTSSVFWGSLNNMRGHNIMGTQSRHHKNTTVLQNLVIWTVRGSLAKKGDPNIDHKIITIILLIGTPKEVPLILGNPKPYLTTPLKAPSILGNPM